MTLPSWRNTSNHTSRDCGHVPRPWPHRRPRKRAEVGGSAAVVDRAAGSAKAVVVSSNFGKPRLIIRDAYSQTNRRSFGRRKDGFTQTAVSVKKTFADVGVQTDGPPETKETCVGTADRTPLQDAGLLTHQPSVVTMTRNNTDDDDERPIGSADESAGGNTSSLSFPSTVSTAPLDQSTSKLPTPLSAKRAERVPYPDVEAKPDAWRFPRRPVFVEKLHFSVSACPEVLAAHIAQRCAFGTVVDPFCGVGRLAVRLARTCRRVIAMDVDPAKIRSARRKAEDHGVAHRIDFRVGDSFVALSGVTADAVITSPPWAAPAWDRNRRFSADDVCSRARGGLAGVLKLASDIAPRVVLHVPKTIHMTQSVQVSRDKGFGRVEIEDVTIDGWKNSTNAVLYLKKSSDNDGPIEPILSEVRLDPKSIAPLTLYA